MQALDLFIILIGIIVFILDTSVGPRGSAWILE